MLLSDIAGEYGLTKLAALDACALGGLRVRSFHTELTDSQVERLRWVLGPASPGPAEATGSAGATASSLLSRWDNATQAGGSTATMVAPPPPPVTPPLNGGSFADPAPERGLEADPQPPLHPHFDADFDDWEDLDDDEALDPAHLAALALVEAEEETIDAAALATELRRLAREPEEANDQRPPLPSPAPPVAVDEPVVAVEPAAVVETPETVEPAVVPALEPDVFPPAEGLRAVDEPAVPASRDLPRHPFKPLSFEDVVADLGVQLQEEDKHVRAEQPATRTSLQAPAPAPPPQSAENPPAAPPPPPAPAPVTEPGPAPEPAGRSLVAPPTGGTRLRDLDTGGDAADAGALAFLDHRNVIEATPIPEERPLERRVVGSVVMAVWLAILIGAVVLIVQLRSGDSDTAASADSAPIGDDTVGAVRDVFDLSPGDCFTTPGIGSVQTAVVVPCAEPHTAEVYATVEYPTDNGLFPGDETLQAFGDQACLEAFPGFIGIDYLVSGLDYYFVTPQKSAWNDGGQRTVSCSVIEPGFRPVTGTLEGATR
ncbi:MAG: hypothetical protein GY929_04830 [Actinomycetia bacterium]|nr:hypothetical protein [Actinomycetes bacterium]